MMNVEVLSLGRMGIACQSGSPLTVFSLCLSGFRKNDEMKAMDVLPILKEKVAYLSGKI